MKKQYALKTSPKWTYFGYDTKQKKGIAFAGEIDFYKEFDQFDLTAEIPSFNYKRLLRKPNVWIKV